MWQKLVCTCFVIAAAVAFVRAQAPPTATEGRMIHGRVVAVTDGDQLDVRTADGKVHSLRLHGVDSPEPGQDHHPASKKLLERIVLGKAVNAIVHRKDSKGLLMATVYRAGDDVGLRLLEGGSAWHYKRISGEQAYDVRARYAAAELKAREAKAGLWANTLAIPPWEYREDIAESGPSNASKAVASGTSSPAAAASSDAQKTVPGREYKRGPRGGCYYQNESGTKVYVKDRTLCGN